MKDLPTTGFFVDWDGNTRQVESPGDGYSCEVARRSGYLGVDVLDSEGCICFEAVFYRTPDELKAVGVVINLVIGNGGTNGS